VVVRDKSSTTVSPLYRFATADSEPYIKNITHKFVYERGHWTLQLHANIFDPEGLIRECPCYYRWLWRAPSDNERYNKSLDPTREREFPYEADDEKNVLPPKDYYVNGPTLYTPDGWRHWPRSIDEGNCRETDAFLNISSYGKYSIKLVLYYDRYDDEYVPEFPLWKGYAGFSMSKDILVTDYYLSSPDYGNSSGPTASFTYYPSDPKVNETVTFIANASTDMYGNEVKTSYIWEYTENNSNISVRMGKGKKISYSWNKSGIYDVTLVAVDEQGLKGSVTRRIVVSSENVSSDNIYYNYDEWYNQDSNHNSNNDGYDDSTNNENTFNSQERTSSLSLSFVKPLGRAIYFRNNKLCRFPFTLAIGPIDFKVKVSADPDDQITELKFFIDGKEKLVIPYTDQSFYTYSFNERAFSKKTIKIVAYKGDEEIKTISMSLWILNPGR